MIVENWQKKIRKVDKSKPQRKKPKKVKQQILNNN